MPKAEIAAIGQIAENRESVFTALNSSFLADGAHIVVPDGAIVETPD